jgi:GNAT superfamily N-acetyltransferase
MHDPHYRTLPTQLKPLVDKFYRTHRSPMRAGREDRVWVAQHQEIVAALCLRPIAPGHWLTGLFVAPGQRRQGLARRLIEHAVAQAGGPVWLFCQPGLGDFYRRQGFMPCASLPEALVERLARYQRSKALIALHRC